MILEPLPQDDAGLPDDAPDVRGWAVRTLVDGRRAGRVCDVLAGADGVARCLGIELASGGGYVLLPVGQARAEPERSRLWVPGLAAPQLAQLAAYAPGAGPQQVDARDVRTAYEAVVSGGAAPVEWPAAEEEPEATEQRAAAEDDGLPAHPAPFAEPLPAIAEDPRFDATLLFRPEGGE